MGGSVVEHRQRVKRIAHVRPEPPRVFQLSPGVADFDGSVVGVYDVRSQHHPAGQGIHGPQELGRLQPPIIHRLPRDTDTLSLEDPFQAMQGQVVNAFAHDHLGGEPRRGQCAGMASGGLLATTTFCSASVNPLSGS